jgi:hypothetical protein
MVELTTATQAKLTQAQTWLEEVEKKAMKVKVKDEDDAVFAAETIVMAKRLTNILNQERTALVAPLNEEVSRINKMFKPFLDKIASVREAMENALRKYRQQQQIAAEEAERKRQELLRKEEEARAQGKKVKTKALPDKLLTLPPEKQVAGNTGMVTTRKVVKWRLVDMEKVPREYLTLDTVKINALARQASPDKLPQIDGLEFFIEEQYIAR